MEKLRKEHQDKVVSYNVVFTLVHMQRLDVLFTLAKCFHNMVSSVSDTIVNLC